MSDSKTFLIPNTMRALLYNRISQTLRIHESWPIPKPTDQDEYLIRVHTIAITRDELTWPFPPDVYTDYSPGVEACGTIVATGPNDSGSDSDFDRGFKIGDRVFWRVCSPQSGAARGYTVALGRELALVPGVVTDEEACAVPVSALTAWQALFVQAGLAGDGLWKEGVGLGGKKQTRVLVIGASGSCGIWAVQFARAAGFWTVGTSRGSKVGLVRSLGADRVIDYNASSVREWLEKNDGVGSFDLVLDCVWPGGCVDAWYAAKSEDGLVLSLVSAASGIRWKLEKPEGIAEGVKGRFFIMESNGEQLGKIGQLIGAGKVKAVVDRVFDLEEYKEAFERVEDGKGTGKVVLRVQRNDGGSML